VHGENVAAKNEINAKYGVMWRKAAAMANGESGSGGIASVAKSKRRLAAGVKSWQWRRKWRNNQRRNRKAAAAASGVTASAKTKQKIMAASYAAKWPISAYGGWRGGKWRRHGSK
jgi:hypothetical protein